MSLATWLCSPQAYYITKYKVNYYNNILIVFLFQSIQKLRVYGKYTEFFESKDFEIYKRFPTTITRFIACC